MEPQITPNTQMAWCLQDQDDAFDLETRPAEVEKQAEVQAGGFQIIQALRAMNLVDRFRHFHFDEDDTFDEQINGLITDHDPAVPINHRMLLRDGETRLVQLVHQCVFIDPLKEPGFQRVQYRQGAADDLFRQQVNPTLVGIHLRVLRVLRFHVPCLLPAQACRFVDAGRAAVPGSALISSDACHLRVRRRHHDGTFHGSIRETPQSSNPPTSRVTTLAPLARAMAAIMRSSGAVGRPTLRRAAKIST
jgi:hypothetical protein